MFKVITKLSLNKLNIFKEKTIITLFIHEKIKIHI